MVAFPTFVALTIPFLETDTFLLDEEEKVYFAFAFFFLITICFFWPTYKFIFVVPSFALADTLAGVAESAVAAKES